MCSSGVFFFAKFQAFLIFVELKPKDLWDLQVWISHQNVAWFLSASEVVLTRNWGSTQKRLLVGARWRHWPVSLIAPFKASSTSVCERKTNSKTHEKRVMWRCRQTAIAFIRLCGVCSANRTMLFVWSWYFKEKYVRNHTDVDVHLFGQPMNNQRNVCSFACVTNAEQAHFRHLLAFASVTHALFMFAYRCGCALMLTTDDLWEGHKTCL